MSLAEIRERNVVVRSWDLCRGAAARATILNFVARAPVIVPINALWIPALRGVQGRVGETALLFVLAGCHDIPFGAYGTRH